MQHLENAKALYEKAVFAKDTGALEVADRELDDLEARLALARGRIMHARFLDDQVEDPHELPLFERAAELFERVGDWPGEAEARFWIGCFHQVVRDDHEAATPSFHRAYELAVAAEDWLVLSYVLRHLAFVDQHHGDLDSAIERMTESTRLRREVGMVHGVAANLVALAYLSAAADHREDVAEYLVEAWEQAEVSGAHRVKEWVEEARANLA